MLDMIIHSVLGGYYTSMRGDYLCQETNSLFLTEMSVFSNSRFIMCDEPNITDTIGSAIDLLKEDIYQETLDGFIRLDKNYKLTMQCYSLPVFKSFNDHLEDVLVVIDFPNIFLNHPVHPNERKRNSKLSQIIHDEYYVHEFFEIFVDHYHLYLEEGLILPQRFAEATWELFEQNGGGKPIVIRI